MLIVVVMMSGGGADDNGKDNCLQKWLIVAVKEVLDNDEIITTDGTYLPSTASKALTAIPSSLREAIILCLLSGLLFRFII